MARPQQWLRLFIAAALCAGLLVGSTGGARAEAPAWERYDRFDLLLSTSQGEYLVGADRRNEIYTLTTDASYLFRLNADKTLRIGLRIGGMERREPGTEAFAESFRHLIAAGLYGELGSRYFMFGIGVHIVGILRTRGAVDLDEGVDRSPQFRTGATARFGPFASLWADVRVFHGPFVTRGYDQFNLGVGYTFGNWGRFRVGYSPAGGFLEPTLTVPLGLGRLLLGGTMLYGSDDSWGACINAGFSLDTDRGGHHGE